MNLWNFLIGKSDLNQPDAKHQEWPLEVQKQKIAQWLDIIKPYKRLAYKPITETRKPTFDSLSKIGGYPYLHQVGDWPLCANCKKHMQLFLQLNLDSLPEKRQKGLLQFFYCTSRHPDCQNLLESHKAFSPGALIRTIPEPEQESKTLIPDMKNIFPEKIITSWSVFQDYPSLEELQELGIEIPYDDYFLLEEKQVGIPFPGDKVFGWPLWLDQLNYPYCRKNHSRMESVFQFCSNDHLPWHFSDSGIGHVHESIDGSNEFAFEWSCHSFL